MPFSCCCSPFIACILSNEHYADDMHPVPPLQFRLDYALSREQKNKSGGKMYIQDKVEEYADEVFDLLDNGAHIYFCGLKGMMPGALPFHACLSAYWTRLTWLASQSACRDEHLQIICFVGNTQASRTC